MERVVVHVWSELADPRSLEGILNLVSAVSGRNVAVEHHAFIAPAPEPVQAGDPETHPSTRSAQELIYAAKEQGATPEEAAERGFAMAVRLHEASRDGIDLADLDSLVTIGARAGLDPDALRSGLAEGRWAEPVRVDEADADRLRLRQAPYFIIAGMYSLEGPSTPSDIAKILDTARDTLRERMAAAEAEARELFGWQG
ncbi:DsbA family oxidoreductase [Flaviflexus equikiangi]|uniref:DsbA family protein n=1 Tax=Flaviflexus equikiangi TaxID=2758573 RepID=A0ABS2TBY9_9ACTO|nr:DsbA family protein [Flaviflexus equikiangi]MBM9432156.1 DsbA family protein [Flaviflexus equikiangi]